MAFFLYVVASQIEYHSSFAHNIMELRTRLSSLLVVNLLLLLVTTS